ncbi:3'-5' exonuclease family protein [Parvibium lacunae]|uniref:DNA-directed DNA polymerase n=1 Tax=Parvibium lacunae TaxID=1888893 RepID=A0A368KYV7_9BURK|nr:3'-5' exonuclease family protein [Parvibium lacunae]RCS56598.1 ethanolamine utilization protein [Parvibium lacunae]
MSPISLPQPLIFIDLETSGGSIERDDITEVGIVTVTFGEGEPSYAEWSQLCQPRHAIPEFIQALTGITNDMVADAPTFDEIAPQLYAQLQGKTLIAHNARFDYGFLKQAFKRCGMDFRATTLCTVKLSRALAPVHKRHNLDSLIERYQLQPRARHRALADAEILWQLWQAWTAQYGAETIAQAVQRIATRPQLPPQIDPEIIDQIPNTPGVYLFYGAPLESATAAAGSPVASAAQRALLYVGKSKTLRKRVLDHFTSDHQRGREMSLVQQTQAIEWIETAGELGALLLEAQLVKTRMPIHNQKLRRQKALCRWFLADPLQDEASPRYNQLTLDWADEASPPATSQSTGQYYGFFRSQRAALAMLEKIVRDHQLCRVTLGLEKNAPGQPCFARQLKRCKGACEHTHDNTANGESPRQHHARLLLALAQLRQKTWPYAGPIAVAEGSGERRVQHVIDNWCYYGAAESEAHLAELLSQRQKPQFDLDTYHILLQHLERLPNAAITPLTIPKAGMIDPLLETL